MDVCDLCMTAAEGVRPWLGIDGVCRRCRAGQLEHAAAHWGLELEAGAPTDGREWRIQVRHPTVLPGSVGLSPEHLRHKARKLLGRRDPEVGDDQFDDRIWIELPAGEQDEAMRLLKQPAVQQTIAALLQLPSARSVQLGGEVVTVDLQASQDFADRLVPDVMQKPLEQARHLALVLAALVERYLRRGAQGNSTSLPTV